MKFRTVRIFLLVSIMIFSGMACKNAEVQGNQNNTNPTAEINDSNANSSIRNYTIPEWAKKSIIYGVDIRHYTEKGDINSFSDHIVKIKDLGAEIISFAYLFPFDPTEKKAPKFQLPSSLDFNAINPEIGTEVDFKNLITKIHAYKLKAIVDIDMSHTSWNHPWVKSNPEYYLKDDKGKMLPAMPINSYNQEVFTKGPALDYTNEGLLAEVTKALQQWIDKYDVDGFQINMTGNVAPNFVTNLSKTLSSDEKEIFVITDFRYGMPENNIYTTMDNVFDQLNKIAVGYSAFSTLAVWKDTDNKLPFFPVYYISNPVQNAVNGSEIERMQDAYMAMNVFMFTAKGMPYIYNGQEEPMQKRLSVWEKGNINFSEYKSLRFYKDLIKFRNENPALWNMPYGAPTESIGDNPNVYAIKRTKGDNTVYVLANMSTQDQKVTLTESIVGMKDIFLKTEVNYPKGKEFLLNPWEFVVVSNQSMK